MKIKILALLYLMILPFQLFAETGQIGAGIAVGLPTGITGKYWIDKNNAVDAAFTVQSKNQVYFHVEYLRHDYNALPKPEEGLLPLYYGAGIVLKHSNNFGIRTVMGTEFLFKEYPFGIFIELAPIVVLSPEIDFSLTGSLGCRYYWGR